MVDAGEIYPPAALDAARGVAAPDGRARSWKLPASSCACPAAWRGNRPPRPQVSGTVGGKPPSALGDGRAARFPDGGHARRRDADRGRDQASCWRQSDGLALGARPLGRGGPRAAARHARAVSRRSSGRAAERRPDVRRGDAAGRRRGRSPMATAAGADADWARVVAGPWLAETLDGLRSPEGAGAGRSRRRRCKATLRPYQQAGVRWLHLLARLGLGACLADDMGLGKTIQVLALLLVLQATRAARSAAGPSLLVAPASLLANWASEIERFAPGLTALIAHPSAMPRRRAEGARCRSGSRDVDLVITTYGSLLRVPWLADDGVAARRCSTRRRRSRIPAPSRRARSKQLDAHARIALTGTPVENRLGDLWSIFDFINPGLLGSGKAVLDVRQAARASAAQPVRAAARAGAAVHPAAAEDRQDRHRRPAGQDRGQGVLPR